MNPAPSQPLISTSDLDKIDVRVGTILAVEDVAHSENLVRLRVDFGDHALHFRRHVEGLLRFAKLPMKATANAW
ncbi:hypothetical protein [Bradyrhizobium retamae]|uniref:tRNA-binding domain-containing protein n=1 Tax=Bradyrhizobium retamae TaxID=1300035 RepID=A0A0R3MBU2_9BRAD|nr:hypothetical protein [Bradyrhizobium retamae]KRR17687.1 hypothetical protein CQ13_36050 [Bradyrhizobium retamae]